MNFRQAVVGSNDKNCIANRVGGRHVALFIAAMEMICETSVHSFDVGEFLVSDLSAGKLARKSFERADNWNDLVDLCLGDFPVNGAAVRRRPDTPFGRKQFQRLANRRARYPESST